MQATQKRDAKTVPKIQVPPTPRKLFWFCVREILITTPDKFLKN